MNMDFSKKPILAMIHLTGHDRAVQIAMEEIEILESEGVDGIIVENYHGDISDVKKTLEAIKNPKLLVGINILPNDYLFAFQLAKEYKAHFIQVDYVSGNYRNSPRVDIAQFANCREHYPDVTVLGGVWPKYYHPTTESVLFDDLKQGTYLADAIVVTGEGTGKETPLTKIEEFRKILGKHPLIVGAGMTPASVQAQLSISDGAIVGSCLKPLGQTTQKINKSLVNEFMSEVKKIRTSKE